MYEDETFRDRLGVSIKGKTVYMQVFKRAYKQYRRQHHSKIARNIIETFKGGNSI